MSDRECRTKEFKEVHQELHQKLLKQSVDLYKTLIDIANHYDLCSCDTRCYNAGCSMTEDNKIFIKNIKDTFQLAKIKFPADSFNFE